MSAEHYVLLGIARPRAPWFTEVGRWATSASLPADFVRCVSLDEVRARLLGGRAWSALLVDDLTPGLDRDVIDAARAVGCATVVVADGPEHRDWVDLGAAAVLDAPVHRDSLLSVLRSCAAPLERPAGSGADLADDAAPGAWEGRLMTVVGAGGSGTSTVAAALAQGLAAEPGHGGRVVLFDAALHADQAALHDTGDVIPGLQELVEAHRAGQLDTSATRALTWHCPDRGYDLVLGLRRHRDWTVLRPRAVEAATTSLRRAYAVVVADADADVEGERLTGSLDVEDRNLLARHLTRSADVVLVTGRPSVTGVNRLVRTLGELVDHGVERDRLLPVVNGAPRTARGRAEVTRAVAELVGPDGPSLSPLFLPHRREIDALHRDGAPPPKALVEPVAGAASAVLARTGARSERRLEERVAPRRRSRSIGGAA
ncbi:MAG: hypothetical protein MUE36_04870 [Acidimicrobiales bacterium]|nr:hypothetical protein [Acidimicrobiales bacterium]